MIGKLAVLLLPVILCSATVVDDATSDGCYTLYPASCCALGDGSANSGFTPERKTRCVNEDLGSPWFCPNPNPPLRTGAPHHDKNENTWQHTNCATGEVNCATEWRKAGLYAKCKGRRYTCSTTMHGVCSARPEEVQWDCEDDELGGDGCNVYKDATSTGFGGSGSGSGNN